ncbi:MAG: hypothetical protein HWD62_14680 [Cyclobacteriaceae bacterium]|nr:MAG: hypothetical protein HWD62_14680 [Cyclobacteriaceae bacterium]
MRKPYADRYAFRLRMTTGVFMDANDFSNDRLTYSALCSTGSNKVRLGGKFVKIKIDEGSKKGLHKIKLNQVFGVRTCKNTYRIQDGLDYKVINTKYISLYSRLIEIGAEGSFYEDLYYFSATPEGRIQPLTKRNLKDAYPSNSEFVNYIDKSFKDDSELGVFNSQLNQYMLVYFFEKSKN